MAQPTKFQDIVNSIAKDARSEQMFRQKNVQALDWYRRKINTAFGTTPGNISQQLIDSLDRKFRKLHPGWFFTFLYNPKGRQDLPFYDKFPLTLVLEVYSNGFLGLNFHYLRPFDRAIFMDKLYSMEIPDSAHQTFKINITYDMLKSNKRFKYYKPCIKRYLFNNMRSFLLPVMPEEWDISIFLPTERFAKATREEVWKDSRSKY